MSKIISNSRTFISDVDTPVSLYNKLSKHYSDCFLFESVLGGENLGRYSFIGCSALDTFISFKNKSKYPNNSSNPYEQIKNFLNEFATNLEDNVSVTNDLEFFHQGLVGFMSFESMQRIEPCLDLQESHLPESFFYLAGNLIVFDHVSQKLYVVNNILLEDDYDQAKLDGLYQTSNQELDKLSSIIHEVNNLERKEFNEKIQASPSNDSFKSNTSKEEFIAMVNKAKEHILEGDIFQVVLSQRFEKETQLSALDLYRVLRSLNPSPYLFIFNANLERDNLGENFTIVGSSPEMLIKTEKKFNQHGAEELWAELRPIAGTYKRGQNQAQDIKLAEKLLNDPKERAEHVMLLDLGRNDLGRVCEHGSIHVAQNMIIEKYSHVLHIVSSLKGKLKSDMSSVELLEACFPAGTLSGAPKIEAVNIISKLEKDPRGPYGGCIGYINLDGTINVAIMIRSIIIESNKISIQAGAGVVADSDPESEYQETFNKAAALISAVESTI